MTVYYVTLLLVAIFSLIAQSELIKSNYDVNKEKHASNSIILFFITASVLVFVAGFRYYVGTDFGGYYLYGQNYADTLIERLESLDEPGIAFIYWLIRLFTTKNYVPILVFSIITIGLAMSVIYRNTDCLFMSSLLYMFMCWDGTFNAVRQCLAVSIIFCGFKFLKNKEFWKYLIIVFIAFLFHRSAIIMIAPYFIIRNKVSFGSISLLILGTVFVLYSYDLLTDFTEFILQGSLENAGGYATRNVNILRIIIACAPAVFYIVLYWGKELNPLTSFYIKLTVCHAIVMIMASKSAMIARVGIYTAPFCAIAIPELNKIFEIKTRRIINICILVLYGIYFVYGISISDSLNNFKWIFSFM